ncbi:MAG: DUF2000 family protein [Alphaproteobacteria bacterium]|nr:DUF2000 family protein [Alphaproteobacteria bacterium]
MQFETKIAFVIRQDLGQWEKIDVAAFPASGIAGAGTELVGEPYADADGARYLRLCVQPMLVYAADGAQLARALDRALARGVEPAIYTDEMFATTHDAANRAALKSVRRADFKLAGIALRAARKTVDKIVDGLKFHT